MTGRLTALFAICAATSASAAHWNVDRAKSHLSFSVPWQGQPFNSEFKTWSAQIDFDQADLAHAKADVSVDLGSAVSGDSDTDGSVRGPQGFDAPHFATAKFLATSFKSVGPNRYSAQGTLGLHGASKPVTVNFTLQNSGNNTHMTGTADVIRTDFGIGTGEFAGDTPVGHKVTVKIDITATKAP